MPTIARIGIAVAVILIVGVVGLNLTRTAGAGPAGPAGPSPTASSTTTSTTTPPSANQPSAETRPVAYTWPGPLPAGTYTTSLVWDVPFMTTFTVPAGWEAFDIEITRDPTMFISFQVIANVNADPCAKTPLDPGIGPSVSDLVDGLASIKGATATNGSPVSFGGASGSYVELALQTDPGCSLEQLSLFRHAAEEVKPGQHYGGQFDLARYGHHRIWILDVGGVRYVIDAAASDDATPADLAEQQAILDSIQITAP